MPKEGKFRTSSPLGTCSIHGSVGRTGPYLQRAPSQATAQTQPVADQRGYLFILADEVLPSGKLVRKVLLVPANHQEFIAANPELFGLHPKGPNSSVSIGEHALGDTKSRFTSASSNPKGAPNFKGRPVYIDIKKAKAAGVRIYSTEEIRMDLDRLVRSNPSLRNRAETLKKAIQVEGEALLEGHVPPSTIKSAGSMRLTQGFRFVQVIGVGLTFYDLGMATAESVEKKSIKPIAAEGIRQVGGWGGATVGMQAGAALGAAVGWETGPGVIVTTALGALVFGTAGYFGADWVADFVDEN
jgi:hypothetical protein